MSQPVVTMEQVGNRFPYVQARHFHRGRRRNSRILFVVHDMEVADSATTAENVARYFEKGAVQASAHFCIDGNSIVQCVQVGDTAFAAPGANSDGIQFELAGFARNTMQQWLAEDDVLTWGACAAADVLVGLRRFGIDVPIRKGTTAEVRDSRWSGFCGHYEVSDAFKKSTHWDPGAGFPWHVFLPKVEWWVSQLDRDGYEPHFR